MNFKPLAKLRRPSRRGRRSHNSPSFKADTHDHSPTDFIHGHQAAAGHVLTGSRADLVRSGVAVAVPAGQPVPDISTEAALKAAVLAAPTLGYSTGPSGVQLAKQFEAWGIAETIAPRIVQAKPGVPVGSLVAKGDVSLGFQQLSEMLGVAGITIVGGLPPAVEIITTFSGSVAATCNQPDAMRVLLAFWQSPACDALKRQHGMAPA
jgi:molybdate transport system substrate-binding protein